VEETQNRRRKSADRQRKNRRERVGERNTEIRRNTDTNPKGEKGREKRR
jgi:hypothetical protein